MPVDHSGRAGWEGQLSQLADLLESDPEAGAESVRRWFGMNDPEKNPEFPDPIPHESAVRAPAISARGWYDEIGDHPRWCRVVEAHSREDCRMGETERQDLADEIEMDLL